MKGQDKEEEDTWCNWLEVTRDALITGDVEVLITGDVDVYCCDRYLGASTVRGPLAFKCA